MRKLKIAATLSLVQLVTLLAYGQQYVPDDKYSSIQFGIKNF